MEPLNDDQIEHHKIQLGNDWVVINNQKIKRQFEFGNFVKAMDFVNKLAKIAEEQNHHPDLFISYNKVTVEISTHKIQALTEKDFILASKINDLNV